MSGPAQPIDAALPGYRLPDSSDLKLLARILQLSPHNPVILMIAFGTPEITKGALDLGAHKVITKPFEMRDLEGLPVQACASGPGPRGA